MNTRLINFFKIIGQRQDLALVGVLVMAITMMIMPMPSFVADILIGMNLSISVLLLMVAVYIGTPLELAALPGVILVSTVFRLSIEVAVTRMILNDANAGEIVATFGEFVLGGNIIVGLVVFLIITTVQFIVITKGTERVAEVGARFTLDAMPGKQMSIDSDLRSGDIDQAEARKRRHNVASESALHGAMDGAMKFVKGDSIAGLVIIMVNLVGGITIGAGQRGMPIGQALETYSLLTVGDALISQIPALLISLSAAMVVTRVGGQGVDLGRDMVSQLMQDKRALRVAALVLLGMALVPGFPKPVFLIISFIFLCASGFRPAQLLNRKKNSDTDSQNLEPTIIPPETDKPASSVIMPSIPSVIALCLSPELSEKIPQDRLSYLVQAVSDQVSAELGISIPGAQIVVRDYLKGHKYVVELEEVPIEENEIQTDRILLKDDPVHLDLAGVEAEKGAPFLGRESSFWVDAQKEEILRQAGIGFMDAPMIIAARMRQIFRRYASRFVGLQETRQILTRMEVQYSDLVRETLKLLTVQRLSEVLRRLIDEQVSIRNLRLILETLIEYSEQEKTPSALCEYVRRALGRQICYHYANAQKIILAYVLTNDTENVLRRSSQDGGQSMPNSFMEKLVGCFAERYSPLLIAENQPIIVVSQDLRRSVREIMIQNQLDVAVISYRELVVEFPVHPLGPIGMRSADIASLSNNTLRPTGS